MPLWCRSLSRAPIGNSATSRDFAPRLTGGRLPEIATWSAYPSIAAVPKKLELFAEWDAFFPSGGIASAGPRHYAVGGLVYFITPNFEVGARAGIGLNNRSNDFLAGVGLAARY